MDYELILNRADQNHTGDLEEGDIFTSGTPRAVNETSNVSAVDIKRFMERKRREERNKVLEARREKMRLMNARRQRKDEEKRVRIMKKYKQEMEKEIAKDKALKEYDMGSIVDDDYGYVSQESSTMYDKIMENYRLAENDCSSFEKKEINEVRPQAAYKSNLNGLIVTISKEPEAKKESGVKCEEAIKAETNISPAKCVLSSADIKKLLKVGEKKQHEQFVFKRPVKRRRPDTQMTQNDGNGAFRGTEEAKEDNAKNIE